MRLDQVARHAGGVLHGDASVEIVGAAPLDRAGPTDLSFLAQPRFRRVLAESRAGCVLLREPDLRLCPGAAVVVDNPYLAFARVLRQLVAAIPAVAGVHPTACVEADCQIDPTASVGPMCYVGPRVRLGSGVRLGPGCVLMGDCEIGAGTELVARVTVLSGVRIGADCRLHPGAVIGADGFGLAQDEVTRAWERIPQLGGVVLGDRVDIGANTTVDRGALDATVLEDGVKLDNQVQVAHNCHIGADTAVAACVGISGSVEIGRRCTIAGAVGVAGHLSLCDDVHITGMSRVTHSIRTPGVYSSGSPLDSNRAWRRNSVRFKQLDSLYRRVARLEALLDAQPLPDASPDDTPSLPTRDDE